MTPDEPKPAHSSRALLGLRLAAFAVIGLGGIILAQATQIGRGAGYMVVRPNIFPLIVGIGFLVLGGLFLLRTTVWLDKDLLAEVTAEEATTDWATTALGLLVLVGYAALLHPLGYPLATALFFPAGTRILHSTHLRRDIIIGLVLGFAIYLIFTRVLGVRLPAGILAGIL